MAAARGWSDDTLVVNVQGDEPFLPPELIEQAAELLIRDPAEVVASYVRSRAAVAPEDIGLQQQGELFDWL